MQRGKLDLSIVIPVVERHGDLKQIFSEYCEQVRLLGLSFEVLFIVDERQKETLPVLRQIVEESDETVLLIVLGAQFGESAALTAGFEQSRGDLIMTVPAYFQVDPEGVVPALEAISQGSDIVVGRRHPRIDSLFNRIQTRMFHWIVKILTRTNYSDVSCGFRVLRRPVADELKIYGGQHRFMPILAEVYGFDVTELPLEQRQEDVATRYYGVPLYFKRLLDILTIFFLSRFTHRPLRFFGPIGLVLAGAGTAITLYLGIYRIMQLGPIAQRPMLLLGALLIVLGIQILSLGLVGELIIFTHARSSRLYRIDEIIQKGPEDPSAAV